ncbi:S41 family peptidase [Solimonas soli]|uniref:S41 family peptidase n=1 Tax=Solimonas soli TaxID=413479 RepID=UPI0009FED0DC|nr:S41 family peptidase [Solimonas soli]
MKSALDAGTPQGRFWRFALAGAVVLALHGCGGGGGDNPFGSDGVIDPAQPGSTAGLSIWQKRTAASDRLAARCAQPRSGTDPYTHEAYPDGKGSLNDEKYWLRTYMDEVYFWYDEVPSVDARPYDVAHRGSVFAALDGYFNALLTPGVTASGKLEDQFSFTYPTADWEALSQGGVEIGYGLQFAALSRKVPRDYRVAYVDPKAPTANKVVARGARILTIDGVSIDATDDQGRDTLNAGLFPAASGEQHAFRVLDDGAGTARDVVLMSAQTTSTPVQNVHSVTVGGTKVGYLLFNDHIATAEGQLIDAINQLKADGVSDLVLDIRYNGGGYLDIASELAYMIAGSSTTSGKVFERLSFNDKNPLATDTAFTTTGFHSTSQGFDASVPEGTALPQLGLGRVYVLMGPGTCSASEAVINGLRGVDVDVVLIGDTSCGKPYGFFAQDNCGLSYFAIEFAGVNAKNVGNYADGFDPDCAVADDFSHALGDTNEALFATALNLRAGGTCPASAKRAGGAPLQLLRSPLRENGFLRRPS